MAMTNGLSKTPLADGSTSHPPAVELIGQTRHREARIAVGTAAGLIKQGISPSDIVITAVDLDPYEDLLERAAKRYGLTLAVWTPLNLKRTRSYQFAASLLAVLRARSGGAVDMETLGQPLRLGWVPPQTTSISDPLSPKQVDTISNDFRGQTFSISEWTHQIATSDFEDRTKHHLIGYLNWLDAQPRRPSPDGFLNTIHRVMTAYDESNLPSQIGHEPVSEVAETLRGFDRTLTLLQTVHQRYSKWLDYGRMERDWDAVYELLDAFATTLPGRRELPTAAAIDVKEANDMWALNIPYVIAVGLVDTEWPRTVDSAIPSVSRAALARSDRTQRPTIRPHSSWTTDRDYDHFVSAVAAAEKLLVVTRFATDADGVEQHPSRFLEDLETTYSTADVAELIADSTSLPEAIVDRISTGESQ